MSRTHKKVSDLRQSGRMPATPMEGAACVGEALRILAGRWKLILLFHLFGGNVMRFSDLERATPGISQKMLAQQLRQLEKSGVVRRIIHRQVPPKVEYCLTDWGQSLCPVLDALVKWKVAGPAPEPTTHSEG